MASATELLDSFLSEGFDTPRDYSRQSNLGGILRNTPDEELARIESESIASEEALGRDSLASEISRAKSPVAKAALLEEQKRRQGGFVNASTAESDDDLFESLMGATKSPVSIEKERLRKINPGQSDGNLEYMAKQTLDNPAPTPITKQDDQRSRADRYKSKGSDADSAMRNAQFDQSLQDKLTARRANDGRNFISNRIDPLADKTKTKRDNAQLEQAREDARISQESDEMNPFVRGLAKGFIQGGALTGGAAAYFGDLFGSEDTRKAGMQIYDRGMGVVRAMTKAKELENIESLDDAATWITENGGYVAYQAAESILAGGVGGIVGKTIGKEAAIAAGTLAANNLRQTLGSVYGDAVEESQRTGNPMPHMARIMAGAVASAAVDSVADVIGLKTLKGTTSGFSGSMPSRVAKSVGSQMAVQGGTEAAQLIPEDLGAGKDPFRSGWQSRFLNEGAVGALGGAGPGVLGGIYDKKNAPFQDFADAVEGTEFNPNATAREATLSQVSTIDPRLTRITHAEQTKQAAQAAIATAPTVDAAVESFQVANAAGSASVVDQSALLNELTGSAGLDEAIATADADAQALQAGIRDIDQQPTTTLGERVSESGIPMGVVNAPQTTAPTQAEPTDLPIQGVDTQSTPVQQAAPVPDVAGVGDVAKTPNEPSLNKTASWVIRNKETGDVVMETFDKNKVDALNTEKYEAVPIGDYLGSINGVSKSSIQPAIQTTQQQGSAADGAIQQKPSKQSVIKSANTGLAAHDNLKGAIMRVTGNQGIAANMAQTITGDKAGSANPKLRGLFLNGGTMDLGDVAELLRVQENYDVRDGDHLSELIREVAGGGQVYSIDRMERDAAVNAEKQYKSEVNRKAEELGLKKVGGKRTLAMVEADIARVEQERADMEAREERAAIQAEAIGDEIYQEGSQLTEADLMRWLSERIEYTQDDIDEANSRASEIESRRAEANAYDDSQEQAQGSSAERAGDGAAQEGARGTAEEGLTLAGQTNAEASAEYKQQQAEANKKEEEAPTKNVTADQGDLLNTQGALFNSNRDGGPKYSKRTTGGKRDANGRVVVTPAIIDPEAPKTSNARVWAEYLFRKIRDTHVTIADTNDKVVFFKSGIEASLKNRNMTARSLYASLPSILRNAIFVGHDTNTKEDKKPSVLGYDNYIAAVAIDGQIREVSISVELLKSGSRENSYYYHQVGEVVVGDLVGKSRPSEATEPPASTVRLGDMPSFVNNRDVRHSFAGTSAATTNNLTQSDLLPLTAKEIGSEALARVLIDGGWIRGVHGTAALDAVVASVEGAKLMVAWHGSPHDHDKFDSSKIGTGEGAQAYGYGLYFSGARSVAEWYKNKLSNGDDYDSDQASNVDGTIAGIVSYIFRNDGLNRSESIDRFEGTYLYDDAVVVADEYDDVSISDIVERLGVRKYTDSNGLIHHVFEDGSRFVDIGNGWDVRAKSTQGKLYQVELAPSEDEYLDFDRPLSDLTGSAKASIFEGRPNGVARDPKSLGDLVKRESFRSQGFSSLDAPTQAFVLEQVLAAGKDDKVFNSVVRLIPVDMMNILTGKELSAEVLFHNKAVLHSRLSALSGNNVAGGLEATSSLMSAVARETAKNTASLDSARAANNFNAAYGTGAGYFHIPIITDLGQGVSGGDFYKALSNKLGSDKAASDYLHSIGIRGIRYLDGTSRGAGKGSHNYVIFADEDVKITAKYAKQGESQSVGVSLPDGRIVLNLDALTAETFGGVLKHEGFHSFVEGLLGKEQFAKLLKQLDTSLSMMKGSNWLTTAKAAVPSDTAPQNVTEEVASYAIEQYANGEKQPNVIKRWVESFLSAIRTALIRSKVAPEKLRMWAMKNVKPQDLANLAVAALRTKAQAEMRQEQGVGGRLATAYSQSPFGPESQHRTALGDVTEIEVDGVKRPALNSNGKPIHWSREGVENFWRWFGSSRVVDADGRPLVVYHGTKGDFDVFNAMGAGAVGVPDLQRGVSGGSNSATTSPIWLTTDPTQAFTDGSEGSNVMPLYVRIETPLRRRGYFGMDDFSNPSRFKWFDNGAQKWITPDGVIGENGVVVAFSPTQIKSATGNRGTFDGSNPDIRYSRAAPQRTQSPPEETKARFDLPNFGKLDQWQERVQDRYNRIRDVVAAVRKSGLVNDTNDFSMGEDRFHGVAMNRMEQIGEDFESLIKDMKAADVTLDEVTLYAYAEHAPERNAAMQRINKDVETGSGMSDQESSDILDKAKVDGKDKDLSNLSAKMRGIAERTLKLQLSSGLITQSEYDTLTNKYKKWVPLRGFETLDEDGKTFRGSGKGFNIRGKENLRALGRDSKAGQILENIILDAERAAIRGTKNTEVNHRFLRFVLDNPDATLWEIDRTKMQQAMKNGKVSLDSLIDKGDNTIGVKVNGEVAYVKIHDDKLFEQLANQWEDIETKAIPYLGEFQKYLSKSYTAWSPEFALYTNPVRDVQAALVSITGREGVGMTARFAKNFPKALAAAYRSEVLGKPDAWFDEYKAMGGRTGFWNTHTLQSKHDEIQALIKDMEGLKLRNAWRQPLKMAKALEKLISGHAGALENATRLASYMAMREAGRSKEQAAEFSKNLNVNFNRRGTWTPMLGSIFLFFNPAIQGTHNMYQTLTHGKHKKQAWALVGGGVMAMFALAMLNAGAGEDDDGVKWWDKIPDYEKERNIIVVIPSFMKNLGEQIENSTGRYIKFPMPYGWNTAFYSGVLAADVARNADNPAEGTTAGKGALLLGKSFATSFSPVTGLPPQLAPFYQQAANKKPFGEGQLYPEHKWNEHKPGSEKYSGSMKGSPWQEWASFVNSATGGNKYQAGFVSIPPAVWRNYARSFLGGPMSFGTGVVDSISEGDVTKAPFARKIYGEVGNVQDMAMYYRLADEAIKVRSGWKDAKKAGDRPTAEAIYQSNKALIELGGMAEDTNDRLGRLYKKDLSVKDDPNLTDAEKKLKLKINEKQRSDIQEQFLKKWRQRLETGEQKKAA